MRNKYLLLTLITTSLSLFSFNLHSQSYNEDDKEGLRKFLRQQSAVLNKTNIECLGFSATDTINWYLSEDWLETLQQPRGLVYLDWAWDMGSPGKLTRLEFKSFDDSNTQLAGSLDCTYFSELEYLDCSNSQLETINVLENMKLRHLNCSDNNLTDISTIQCNLLSYLNCSNNKLTDLDVSLNFCLVTLNCSNNDLSYLSVNENHNLLGLSCAHNAISNLVLPKSPVLESLDCSNNNISELSLTRYINLKLLSIDNNQMANIDISDNKYLVSMYAQQNKIEGVEANSNNDLTVLDAAFNQLDELNLIHTPRVEYLYGQNNLLEDINTASAPGLLQLNLANNQMSTLDLSSNPHITDLNIAFNNIEEIRTSTTAVPFLSFIANDNYLRFSTLPVDLFDTSNKMLLYSPQAEMDMGDFLYATHIDLRGELNIKNTITSYEWINEDGTPASFTKVADGVFTASVNDDATNYCKATNSLLPELTLFYKVKTIKDTSISIIENTEEGYPFYYDKHSQSIHILNPDLIKSIDLFDTLGRLVNRYDVVENTISVQGLSTGVYVVKINLKSGKNISHKVNI